VLQHDSHSDGGRLAAFSVLSRRRFLKAGVAASGVAVAGSGGLFALLGRPRDAPGLKVLNRYEFRTLRHLAAAHLPRGGPFPEGAGDFDLARALDTFLADEPAENIRNLKLALWLVEFGPLRFEGRLRTFSHLPAEERRAHWAKWVRSGRVRQRQIATAFGGFLSMVFYDQEAVWPHIGYPGPMDLGRGT